MAVPEPGAGVAPVPSVEDAGVGVQALGTAFDPPDYRLREPDPPVALG